MNSTASPPTTRKSPLPAPKVLLLGDSGTGKTYAIRTLLDAGVTPFCLFTEPGQEVLGDLPPDKCHWHYIPPASQDWAAMLDIAGKINTFSFESLTKMADTNRRQYDQFVSVLKQLSSFTCQRTGEVFGDSSEWGTNRALVLDSLSGLNIMAMALVVGGKPVRNQADWGVAQTLIANLMQKLCTDFRCGVVVIAHPERETDEVLGGSKVMVSTLGKKLAPTIPRFFSDVVMAQREGTKFSWSTATLGAALKARNLPIADGLPASFAPIYAKWRTQGGVIE